jgi:hypothetical protein
LDERLPDLMTATAQFDLTLRRLDHKATGAKNCAERAKPVLLRAPGPRLVQVELLASSNPESDRSGAEEQERCPSPRSSGRNRSRHASSMPKVR